MLADEDLAHRFDELVGLTQEHLSAADYPWAENRQEVGMRWQHVIETLGACATSYSHPLFSERVGWADKERVDKVMKPINYRSFDASFIENALILTHSLAIMQNQSNEPGLSVDLDINHVSNYEPEMADLWIKRIDLRDMAEPTDTVIGNMTLEEYQALSKDAIEELTTKLFDLKHGTEEFGNCFNLFTETPQKRRYQREIHKLDDYAKLTDYGTTDAGEIRKICDQRKAYEIAQLRDARPDFGKEPEGYHALDETTKRQVLYLFEYFDNTRDPFEGIGMDKYSLFSTLDFTEEDVSKLVDNEVLHHEKIALRSGSMLDTYRLATDYYECWVGRHYPATE